MHLIKSCNINSPDYLWLRISVSFFYFVINSGELIKIFNYDLTSSPLNLFTKFSVLQIKKKKGWEVFSVLMAFTFTFCVSNKIKIISSMTSN